MALPKAGVELVAEGLSGFVSDMGRANSAVSDFGKAGASAGSTFDKGFGEVVTGALRKIGELGVEALLSAGKAVAGFVGDSIGLAGDFEAGMLEFQAVAGKSVDAEGLEEFRDLFLDIGKRLPVSTSEVKDAAIEMVKGGIDPAIVAAGGLEQNIQFASAAMGGDLVAAAETSSKLLGGWTNINATAAEKVDFLTYSTNLLTKAANASSVDVSELRLGIFNAQGIAKTAGVEFGDLTTTLAALSPRFASSSEAGNSLKNVIARLQPTTKPATEAMLGLGLITEDGGNKFFDAEGKFVGFQKASEILKTSLAGLTQQQQVQIMQTIFGNDGMNAAAGLAELGADGYQAMADSLANANGVQENATLKQQGFNTALDNAKGSMEALQITVGSALLPILTDLLNNVVAPGVNLLTDMASAIFGNEEAFNRLSPAAQGIVGFIQTIVGAIGDVIDGFNDAGLMSGIFADRVGDLAEALGLPGDVIEDIVKGIQGLVRWIGDLIEVFFPAKEEASEMAKALGLVEDSTSPLESALNDLSGIWEKMIDVVGNVIDAYQNIAQAVLPIVEQFIEEHGEEISAFFKGAWDQIIRIINLALDLYNAIVPPILNAIAGYITKHADDIQTILKGAWEVVQGVIKGALNLIEGIIKTALALINGDWDGAWKAIQEMSVGFVESLGRIIKGFLDIIAGFFGSSLSEIVSTWQHNWDELVRIATQTDWGAVGRDVVNGIIAGLAAAWGSLVSWITERMANLVNQGLEAVGAKSPAKKFMPIGEFSVQGIMAGFTEWWPKLTQLVSGMGEDLVKQAEDLGMAVQSAVAGAFGATATIDRQVADNIDKLDKITDDFYRKHAAGALEQARITALGMDPQEGAKFFQMRSKQIFEEADLKERIAKAETSSERARLQQRLALINDAQIAEINAFNAQLGATKSGTEQLMESLQGLPAWKGVDAKGKEVGLPGILDHPAMAAFAALFNQLMRPPASPSQQLYGGGSNYYNNRTVNMPVYTNQSPAAIQDSAAIAWASMA